MNQDLIRARCEAMTEQELVMALTKNRIENDAQFLEQAQRHFEERGTPLAEYIDRIHVRVGDSTQHLLSIQKSVTLLDHTEPWQILSFLNCLDDSLIVQRESTKWCCHFYDSDNYRGSFFESDNKTISTILTAFLHLEPWMDMIDKIHQLDDWKLVFSVHSDDIDSISSLVRDLNDARITHTVKSPLFVKKEDDPGYSILVPSQDIEAAYQVIEELEASVEDLYKKAETLAESGNLMSELEVYDLLKQTDPENFAVLYNRGQILRELGRNEEAANSLIEAASLGLQKTEPSVVPEQRSPQGLGSVTGLLAFAFGRPNRQLAYPDYLIDCEILLEELLQRLGGNIDTFHCLASIANVRNNRGKAEEYYRRILEIDPDDQVAYFNLGYLHSEKG